MAKEKTVTRRMSISVDEAIHMYCMAHFIKDAFFTIPPEVKIMADQLKARIRKLYPELGEHFDKLDK